MNIYIGCDHAAVEMKNEIRDYLKEKGHALFDMGIGEGEKVDYPDMAERVALSVRDDKGSRGVLICGTGVGMAISANKVKGIRAASVSEAYSAKLTRMHNNSDIICFGARVIGIETAKMIIDAFMDAEFEGGERHERRVNLIDKLEESFGK